MAQRKKPEIADGGQNMVPMIDVVFQLLIFFLLTAKISLPEGKFDANLPKEGGAAVQAPSEKPEDLQIFVRHNPANRRMPDMKVGAHVFTKIEELQSLLITLQAGTPDRPVIIDSEGKVPFQNVMDVMNACVKAGFREISFSAPMRLVQGGT